ncbi:hypothetical protein DFR52_106252 [Hoeflea marina]|uniref:Mor transcription activator family protein n=1 Tax=Hoeflea marina TaxID=274592 RepID=A0A317PJE5_9HYPH|nr:hypothetical protein [Hoeflea marina]PWV97727.1 hypothetical protein DFR52_106252 [Hoeflea marina]
MKHVPSTLPGILGQIADVAGVETALAVAGAVGGTRVQIPAYAKGEEHWLTDLVGAKQAALICDHFRILDPDGRAHGLSDVLIPQGPHGVMARAKRQFLLEIENGASVAVACRRSGLHERTAFRLLSDQKHGNQLSLLDLLKSPSDPER